MAKGKVYEQEPVGWRHIQAGDLPSGSVSPLTTKGDVWGFSTVDARIPVGSDNQVLVADSSQTLGVKWAAAPSTSGGAMTLVGTTVLGAAASSISIGSIPGTGSSLLIVGHFRSTVASGVPVTAWLQYNSDTGANYSWQFTNSHGGTVGGFSGSGAGNIGT